MPWGSQTLCRGPQVPQVEMGILVERCNVKMVSVPAADAMDAETLRLHLNARHIPAGDFGTLTSLRSGSTLRDTEPILRTYHAHLHERKQYDHEHSG